MTEQNRTEIGDVNAAARLYRTDAAGIWAWVCSDRPRTLTDGRSVWIVAEKRYPDGRWIIEACEEQA